MQGGLFLFAAHRARSVQVVHRNVPGLGCRRRQPHAVQYTAAPVAKSPRVYVKLVASETCPRDDLARATIIK
jgi:hypothetical protein